MGFWFLRVELLDHPLKTLLFEIQLVLYKVSTKSIDYLRYCPSQSVNPVVMSQASLLVGDVGYLLP